MNNLYGDNEYPHIMPSTVSPHKFNHLVDEVLLEVERQHTKWGHDAIHPASLWLTILMEEVGEVAKALLEHNPTEYRKELVQVAAVCLDALRSFEDDMTSRK